MTDPLKRAREALDKAIGCKLTPAEVDEACAALDELEKERDGLRAQVDRLVEIAVIDDRANAVRIGSLEAQLAAQPKPEDAIELSLRLLTELHNLAQWPNNPGKQAERRAQMIEQLSEGVIPVPAPAKGETDG